MQHKWTYRLSRNRLTDIEKRLVVAQGKRGLETDGLGVGIRRCRLLRIGWINKVLLYSTGSHSWYAVIKPYWKRMWKRIYIFIFIYLNHLTIQQKLTKYYKSTTCQAPLSMEFSRQEYWSGLPFPPPGDLPDPGIEPVSLESPALAWILYH